MAAMSRMESRGVSRCDSMRSHGGCHAVTPHGVPHSVPHGVTGGVTPFVRSTRNPLYPTRPDPTRIEPRAEGACGSPVLALAIPRTLGGL
jgi:hypothetical protein